MAARAKTYDRKAGEDLNEWYNRLAKVADQRLLRLEKASKTGTYKEATRYAYAKASKQITQMGGSAKKPRFYSARPTNARALKAAIGDVYNFLQSQSSTVSGIKKSYVQRTETINKKYGTKFTVAQLQKMFESGQMEKWFTDYGSKTALRTIGRIQHNKQKVLDAVKSSDTKHVEITDSRLYNRHINKALADSALNIEDLF